MLKFGYNYFGKYPSNPAYCKRKDSTAEVRAEIVKYGLCQPKVFNFRKIQRIVLFTNHGTWRITTTEIGWSTLQKKIECSAFAVDFSLASHPKIEENWSVSGDNNFKKGLEKINKHKDSKLHCISLGLWKSFHRRLMLGQTSDLQEELNKEREKALLVLDRIFSASWFLAIQRIPFWGHWHESQEDMMHSFRK